MSESKYDVPTKTAVLSVVLLIYTMAITTPALGEIAKAFPDVSPETIKMIVTIPSLMMVISSFVCGQLERLLSSKKILYIALFLIFCGGIMPAFFGGITFVLIMRAVFEAGYGMVFPLASSIIADLFEGRERDKLMGYKSSVGALAGVIFQMLGGYLAAINWRFAFLGFLLVLPIAFLIWAKLPDPGVKTVDSAERTQSRLSATTYRLSIMNAFYNILQFSFMTNIAIVLTVTGAGNAAQAGMILTVFTAVAFVAGLIFGKVSFLLKRFTITLAIGCVGTAFFIMLHADSLIVFNLAAALFGMGFGLYNPDFTLKIINSAHKTASTLALSVYVALTGLGQFASPFVLSFTANLFNLSGPKAPWTIAAAAILGFAICLGLYQLVTKPATPAE